MSTRVLFRWARPLIPVLAALLLTAAASDVSAITACRKVNGQFTLQPLTGPDCTSAVGICATGTFKGDIKGTSTFIGSSLVQTVDTPTTSVILLTGDATISTDRGELVTKDAIVLSTTGAGNFAEVDTIVGATGDFAGATGQLKAIGTFTAAGGDAQYTGELCTP